MTALASIKSALDPLFGSRVYRDAVPELSPDEIVFPCATILADVSRERSLIGDGVTLALREVWQIDVWQEDSNENDALTDDVLDALDGLVLSDAHLRVRIDGVRRLIDEERLIHYAITVQTHLLG